MTAREKALYQTYRLQQRLEKSGIAEAPPLAVRAMAEWEELQGLEITWTSYYEILAQIVDYAQEEVTVYIVCSDSNQVKAYLNQHGVPLTNTKYLIEDYDTIWCRDYGPWSAYESDVQTLDIIDWIYNRPRPHDDVIPSAIAAAIGKDIYEATQNPDDLVHTGGNFMVDGHGTGFASKLILNENSDKTEAEIDDILYRYLGVNRFVKMETLPYDEIHHIDMHMKLLDEETLLVGEYPEGVADGPQIEALVTGGTRLTFIRRRALYNYNAESLTVEGTDANPVLVYAAGETMARASAGVNRWNHLWCVGIDEGAGGIVTSFAARVDPNGGASLTATNCIFSTAYYDGIFMNFDASEPINYEIIDCTFYNVPELIRFGFVGEPGPSENVTVTVTDCIIDNADWVAPNDGTYWAPEPTVVHYGDADNTLAQLTLNNLAYRTQTFVSSMSGAREPATNGNIIENADFQFKTTELTRDNFDDFLVVANCDLLEGKATNGAPLDGARPSPCATGVADWQLH